MNLSQSFKADDEGKSPTPSRILRSIKKRFTKSASGIENSNTKLRNKILGTRDNEDAQDLQNLGDDTSASIYKPVTNEYIQATAGEVKLGKSANKIGKWKIFKRVFSSAKNNTTRTENPINKGASIRNSNFEIDSKRGKTNEEGSSNIIKNKKSRFKHIKKLLLKPLKILKKVKENNKKSSELKPGNHISNTTANTYEQNLDNENKNFQAEAKLNISYDINNHLARKIKNTDLDIIQHMKNITFWSIGQREKAKTSLHGSGAWIEQAIKKQLNSLRWLISKEFGERIVV